NRFTLFIILFIIVIALIIFLVKQPRMQKISTAIPQQSPTSLPTKQPVHISLGAVPNIPLQLPQGFTIHTFADGLGSPRDLQFTPEGTLLVSNPNSNQVIALPDKNHDGVADNEKIIISGESHVHGLAFYNGKLFIADVNKLVRYNWDESSLQATKEKVLFS